MLVKKIAAVFQEKHISTPDFMGRKEPIQFVQKCVEGLGAVEKRERSYSQYFTNFYEQNKVINFFQLQETGIPNLRLVYNKGVRGETLSASRNTKFIPIVKASGIDTVIDLRTTDCTAAFKDKCHKFGLRYFHIPIDKTQVSDREILDNLPTLFRLIDRGKFYIACAQGKHRTDIALAIHYVFNPKQKIPPYMSGHTKNNITDMEDINRRLNSLYKAMTPEDRFRLGWPKDYDAEFLRKKKILKTYSESQ